MSYYLDDLAWVHNAGYSSHARHVAPGLVRLLRRAGLARGDLVLDIGCGGGVLAAELLAAGYAVHGLDASRAMVDLARSHAPGAQFDVLRLPTGRDAGAVGALPRANAVVSTGHVLNYLDDHEATRRALGEIARAVQPGGVIAIDLMTERFCEARDIAQVHARVHDDWAIVTRFSRPGPFRYDREITVFRRIGESWRRSDEVHRNMTFEAEEALQVLHDHGIEADARTAFGEESLPEGLVVLSGLAR
ncbi:MAG TPA: class I SAM-dependent methyltransferase [Burkholderiaceae bacterium]|nr:class I SAM-dependent methyltransferase [Burkholderiaceae bacterium]